MTITNPAQIQALRLKTIKRALQLEIKTGMRHSTNAPFRAAKLLTGEKTRKKCLAKMEEMGI